MGVFVGEDDETKTDILQAAKRRRRRLLFQGSRGARVREDSFRPQEAAELDMVQEPREEMECLAMVG